MKTQKIFFISVLFLLFIQVDIISQTNQIDTLDSYEYLIKVEKFYFYTNNTYHPFTLYFRPHGYWGYSDIFYGHNVKSNNFQLVWPQKEKKSLKYKGFSYVYDTIEIDTLKSYFTLNENHKITKTNNNLILSKFDSLSCYQTRDSFNNLVKDLKYSFLLSKTFRPELSSIKSNKELRILYPIEVYPFVRTFGLIRLDIKDDSVKIFYSSINVANLQRIILIENDSSWLKSTDIKRLKKRINAIDFNANIDCNTYKQPFLEDFEVLLEYNNGNNYYYFFLCDASINKSKCIKATMDSFFGLRNLLIHFSRKYF